MSDLLKAASRHAKPFKCGPVTVRREVIDARGFIEIRKPVTYQPPLDRICPACGVKHAGFFQHCSQCQNAMNRGD
jgi:hypothetical protein